MKELKTKCTKLYKPCNSLTKFKIEKTWRTNIKKIGCSKSKESLKLSVILITNVEMKEKLTLLRQDLVVCKAIKDKDEISIIKCAN
tara:strand:- start:539 stop:796 length:258 start_codon:yes stop_codon:yes gene_type:complete